MAKSTAVNVVTLVAPDGSGECNVSDVASLSSLHYGSGYALKGKLTYDEAVEKLSGQIEEQVAQQPVSGPTGTTTVTPATPPK